MIIKSGVYSRRYFSVHNNLIACRGARRISQFQIPFADPRSKSMMNYAAANPEFQPGEIDASKVLLDTFPLLFVHVAAMSPT